MATNDLPRGFKAMGIFLIFGASMAGLAGTTLMWPGTILDRLWVLNASAYRQLAPLGRAVGVAFLFLAIVLAVACRGWFLRRRWGWALTVAIVGTQLLGDLGNAIRGDLLKGAIGFLVAGFLLLYILRSRVRAAFGPSSGITRS